MQIIELDASKWSTITDFLVALRAAIEAPEWHGLSPDAFIDSMIWGGINRLDPPYEIQIIGMQNVPPEVNQYVHLVADALKRARQEKRVNREIETEVSLRIVS
jgi:hypothetical protein